jgi:hypothetical protein
MKDSIVEETRKFREELCAEFDFDLHRIAQYYLDLQLQDEQGYVTREMLLREKQKHSDSRE